MALRKPPRPSEQTIRAVFENGVLRPLQPLRLKEKSRVTLRMYAEKEWRDELEKLLRRMKSRTKNVRQSDVDAEITKARAEVKADRRAVRRSA
jgi:predicted DNA-binding antitoxin AbrB/MazE fold protein